jgi:hypothetical protein
MADLKPLGINSPSEPKQRQIDPDTDRLLIDTLGPQGGASNPLIVSPVKEVPGSDHILEIRDGGVGTVFTIDGDGTVSITPSSSGADPSQWVTLFSFGEYSLELQGVTTHLSEISPEGVISAPPGSTCHVRYPVANANDGLWVKGSGVGNIGWIHLSAPLTDHGALSGLADDDHTQYLLVNGTRAMSGVLRVVAGTVGAPGIALSGETDTGIFSPAADVLATTASGVEVVRHQAPAGANPQLIVAMGSAAKPSLSFNDTFSTAGLFQPAAGMIGFVSGATERWRLNSGVLLAMAADSAIRSNVANQALRLSSSVTNGVAAIGFQFDNNSVNLTAAAGTQRLISASATVAQSGTAAYTGFEIDITESSTGSGTKRLFDAKVGAATKFAVSNAGVTIVGDGAASAAGLGFVSEPNTGMYRASAGTLGFTLTGTTQWLLQGGILYAQNAAGGLRMDAINGVLDIAGRTTSGTTESLKFYNNASYNAAAGTQKLARFSATMAQSATAGYTALEIDITESSTGSGTKKLIDALVGGSTKFYVASNGSVVTGGAYAFTADTQSFFLSGGVGIVEVYTGNTHRWRWTSNSYMAMQSTGSIEMNSINGQLFLRGRVTSGTATSAIQIDNQGNAMIASSGTQKLLTVATTMSQSGTGGYTLIEGNAVETAFTGSGSRRLLDLKLGGTSRLVVSHGTFTASSGVESLLSLTPSVNQSGTAGMSVVVCDLDAVGTGSGEYNFIESKTGGTTDWSITISGALRPKDNDSAGSPGHSWHQDPDSGMYNSSGNEIGFATGGTGRMLINSTEVKPVSDNAVALGSAALRWSDVFAVQTTIGDLNMKDPQGGRAHLKIVEGEGTLTVFDIRNGKKYRVPLIEDEMSDDDMNTIARERARWPEYLPET